jgi:hypothetical protein
LVNRQPFEKGGKNTVASLQLFANAGKYTSMHKNNANTITPKNL